MKFSRGKYEVLCFGWNNPPPRYTGAWPGGEKAALQKNHECTPVDNLKQSHQRALAAQRRTASWAELARV